MFKNEKFNIAIFLDPHPAAGSSGSRRSGLAFNLIYLPIMLGIYLWIGLGTTLYLHRYLTHRGFEMPGWLKFIFATGSAIGLSGDPVTWVGDHRFHHLKSDTEEDIHSPRHGFPYAHMMWLIRKPPSFRERSLRYAADVRKIWYCKLWENSALYVLPHLAVAGASFRHSRVRRDALVSLCADSDHLQLHLGGELDLPHEAVRLSHLSRRRMRARTISGLVSARSAKAITITIMPNRAARRMG